VSAPPGCAIAARPSRERRRARGGITVHFDHVADEARDQFDPLVGVEPGDVDEPVVLHACPPAVREQRAVRRQQARPVARHPSMPRGSDGARLSASGPPRILRE
jgi:hypothetical protein